MKKKNLETFYLLGTIPDLYQYLAFLLQTNQMGSIAQSKEETIIESNLENLKWDASPVGKFTFEVDSLQLTKLEDRVEHKEDIMVIFRLSNQDKRVSLKSLLNKNTPKTMTFFINSCYKKLGRFMSIQILNLKTQKPVDIGFGVVDLHHQLQKDFLRYENFERKIKVFLNYKQEPAGYFQLKTKFTLASYEELHFKVFTAMIRSTLGKNFDQSRCLIKITIGQEVLETKKINSQTNLLDWEGQQMTFRMPSYLNEGKISVIERVGSSDILLGEFMMDLHMLKTGKASTINEQIDIDSNVTGKIQLHYLRGERKNQMFSEPDSPRKCGRKSVSTNDVADGEESIESETSSSISRRSSPPLDIKLALKQLSEKRKKARNSQ